MIIHKYGQVLPHEGNSWLMTGWHVEGGDSLHDVGKYLYARFRPTARTLWYPLTGYSYLNHPH